MDYEVVFFTAVWVISYQAVMCNRNHLILHEAARIGNSVAAVINQKSASGGMLDSIEDMEILFLVFACYVFDLFVSTSWHICRN